MQAAEPHKDIYAIVLGETGSGKSQFIGTLLVGKGNWVDPANHVEGEEEQGRKGAAQGAGGQTMKATLHRGAFVYDETHYNLHVVDTRGLLDYATNNSTIVDTASEVSKMPLHHFTHIFVCVKNGRLSREIRAQYDGLMHKLKRPARDMTTWVVTHTEYLKPEVREARRQECAEILGVSLNNVICTGSANPFEIDDSLAQLNQEWIRRDQEILTPILTNIPENCVKKEGVFKPSCSIM